MTKVTTITEWHEGPRKIITINNSDGFHGRLVCDYDKQEAVVTTYDSEGEEDQYTDHPDDALPNFLTYFGY